MRLILTSLSVFVLWCSLFLGEARAQEVSVRTPPSLDALKAAFVANVITPVLAVLPPQLKAELHPGIVVTFIKSSNDVSLDKAITSACTPEASPRAMMVGKIAGVEARTGKRELKLHARLLLYAHDAELGARSFPCRHKTLLQTARAVVLHELVHAFDKKTRVSKLRQYKTLAGRRQLLGTRSLKTIHTPDPYEYHSASEHLAVNLEYYLLDPEYRCREPLLTSFYDRLFKQTPAQRCRLNWSVITSKGAIASLDPERVYRIDYVAAGQGTAMMSRWGHAFFRAVICAPQRPVVSADCLKDVEHHLALGFQAEVGSMNIDMFKGIVGGYQSRLDILPFRELLKLYNKDELRDVTAYPLTISESFKRDLLVSFLDRSWNYRSAYSFLWNNCADEGLNIFKSIVESAHPIQRRNILTPQGLLKALRKYEWVAPARFESENFASDLLSFENSVALLQRELRGHFEFKNLTQYLNKSSAHARAQVLKLVLEHPGDRLLRARLLSAFYLLETRIYRRSQLEAIERTTGRPAARVLMQNFQDQYPRLSGRRQASYGVPLVSEMWTSTEAATWHAQLDQLTSTTMKGLSELAESETGEKRRELLGSRANLEAVLRAFSESRQI